ncbi:helix-turn-helix domain-containing protein [Denitromonas iodatirespirans]|uniref:Helix-turn-helix transcriptional regulator n=1 Tax=Denitromonas iodatirespirans TaxID=2795389 RepID=A0A944DBK7_DENI1|nr:helix-turn-helix transcriptional regulator [Denitromonas iodatirespirans]MBT0962056.1 helix-turn-helix transcriptional regulator [Denitromonas iodatirespirans]
MKITSEQKKKEPRALPQSPMDGLAVRIRQCRERKGFSLADLHKATGLSRTALHDYESGRTKPGARELLVICEHLEVTPNWLLCGTEEPMKRREGLRSLVRLRNSPMLAMGGMLLFPAILAVIDEDEFEALLTLIASMLEAKDPSTYRHISVAAEFLAETVGEGSPEDLAKLAEKAKDPRFMQELQEKIRERIERAG